MRLSASAVALLVILVAIPAPAAAYAPSCTTPQGGECEFICVPASMITVYAFNDGAVNIAQARCGGVIVAFCVGYGESCYAEELYLEAATDGWCEAGPNNRATCASDHLALIDYISK